MNRPQRPLDPYGIEARLTRIETRICKIMEALDLDPNYSPNNQVRGTHSQGGSAQEAYYAGRDDAGRTDPTDRCSSFIHKFLPTTR
ncbi:MAG: hypothetical protein RLZZ11_1619 [Cyanobacteriota bacterium]